MVTTIRTIRLSADTILGSQDFTIPGFGTPDACIVGATRAVTDGAIQINADLSYGFASFTGGTVQNCSIFHSRDASAQADSNRRGMTDQVVAWHNNAGNINGEGSASLVTDGVRITWGNNPSLGFLVSVTLIKGLTSNRAQSGTVSAPTVQDTFVDVATSGGGNWSPNAVILHSTLENANDSSDSNAVSSIGVWGDMIPFEQILDNTGGGTGQFSWAWRHTTGTIADGSAALRAMSERALTIIDATTLRSTIEIQSAADAGLASGFRMYLRDGTLPDGVATLSISYLAIQVEEDIWVGASNVNSAASGLTPYEATTDEINYVTPLAGAVLLNGLQGTIGQAQSAARSGTTGTGIITTAGAEQASGSSFVDVNGVAGPVTSTGSYAQARAIEVRKHDGTAGLQADFDSFDDKGIIFDVLLTPGTNSRIGALVLGDLFRQARVTFNVTQGSPTAQIDATVVDANQVSFAATQGSPVAQVSARALNRTSFAATQGSPVAQLSARALNRASFAATQGSPTAEVQARTLNPVSFSATQGSPTAQLSARALNRVSFVATQGSPLARIDVSTVGGATFNVTQGSPTAQVSAVALNRASFAATQGSPTAQLSARALNRVSFAATQGSPLAEVQAQVFNGASFSATQGSPTAQLSARALNRVSFSATQGSPLAQINAFVGDGISAGFNLTHPSPTALLSATTVDTASFSVIHGSPTAQVVAEVQIVTATFSAVQGSPTAELTARALTRATFAVVHPGPSAQITAVVALDITAAFSVVHPSPSATIVVALPITGRAGESCVRGSYMLASTVKGSYDVASLVQGSYGVSSTVRGSYGLESLVSGSYGIQSLVKGAAAFEEC